MCPRPQAGSRHVIALRVLLPTTTCSMRARVAQGGVGKSSRLFFSSALCAITACDVFCIVHSVTCRLSSFCVCSIYSDSVFLDNGLIRKRPDEYLTVLNKVRCAPDRAWIRCAGRAQLGQRWQPRGAAH